MGKTLLSHTVDVSALSQMTEEALTDLCDSDLIRTNLDGSYEATKLGHATVAAGLAPETGLFIYDEFKRAIQAFVMDGEMHVLYTFTPVAMTLPEIVWDTFRTQLNNLDDSGLRVAEFCNVDPSFVNQMSARSSAHSHSIANLFNRANGTSKLAKSTPEEISRALIYQRFFAALVLRDLCNEVPIDVLSRTYRMQRGQIQSFAQSAQTFASGMIKFCTRMGWGMLAAVLEHGVDRLLAGAKDDLLDLARIPYVKSRTARVLWENGFKNLNLVAEARPEALANVLMLAQPSKRVGNAEEEERYNVKLKMRAEAIIKGAEKLWERDSAIDFSGDM